MATRPRLAGLALLLAASVTGAAAWAGPAVVTQWRNVESSQAACLDRAEAAIRAAGFGQIERTGQSRFGTRGDYTASIRCVADRGFAVLIIAGPSRTQSARDMDGLAEQFDR